MEEEEEDEAEHAETDAVHLAIGTEKLFFDAVPVGRFVTNYVTLTNVSTDEQTGQARPITVFIHPNSHQLRVTLQDCNRCANIPLVPPPRTFLREGVDVVMFE